MAREIDSAGSAPDQTYAQLARTEIEKLFDAARETVGHESAAFVEWNDGPDATTTYRQTFVTIVNGFYKREGDPIPGWPSMRQAALDAVITVGFMYAGRGQRLLWRQPPVIEHQPAQEADKRLGLPATPQRDVFYMRLGAVPLDVNEFIVRV